MAVARSFSDYVKNKCYNGLFDAAKEYFDEHWDGMDLYSSRVRHITTAEIIDAKIQRVYVTDRPGDGIAFDVGLELEIAVSAADHHTESDDTCYQWLRISCEGDLAVGLDDWQVTNIGVYQKRSSLPQNSMSDALVPEIRYDQLEDVATRFLKEHFKEALQIPRAGQAPVYVDPLVLAERLGLSVRTGHIREDASIFGQIFFADADTEMYDPQQEKMVPVHVDAKTIVADPEVFLLRNLGALNNTIIHECVHWDKHRKVFLLEKLYNAAASGISCEVVGGAKAEMARRATEKMEQQANWLTPRIQMPAAPFKARATELIAKFMRETHATHEIDVMEMVIEQLVVDYQVSNLPFDYDMVVIDELSSFKSYQAKRFRALLQVRPGVRRIVGLTGTPSSNGMMDLWAEYRLLDLGKRLGRFITHYRNRYFAPDKRNGTVVYSYKPLPGAEEQIYDAISDITISMKAADHLRMPELVMNEVRVSLSDEESGAWRSSQRQWPDTGGAAGCLRKLLWSAVKRCASAHLPRSRACTGSSSSGIFSRTCPSWNPPIRAKARTVLRSRSRIWRSSRMWPISWPITPITAFPVPLTTGWMNLRCSPSMKSCRRFWSYGVPTS